MCWIREPGDTLLGDQGSTAGEVQEERSYTYVKLEIVIIIFSKTVLSTKTK